MSYAVRFPSEIDRDVGRLEKAGPRTATNVALRLMHEGLSDRQVALRLALAALRSTKHDGYNRGGFLPHGLMALPSALELVAALDPEYAVVPLLQCAHWIGVEIADPRMGPFLLPDFEPISAGSAAETRTAFVGAAGAADTDLADHYLLALWQEAPPNEVVDCLVGLGLHGLGANPHKLILPTRTLALLEGLGGGPSPSDAGGAELSRGFAPLLLRASARYLANAVSAEPAYELAAEAVAREGLLQRGVRDAPAPGAGEEAAIDALVASLAGASYEELPSCVARALADGLSLAGALDALSLFGVALLLRIDVGAGVVGPVHIVTGINAVRQAAARAGRETRILAVVLAPLIHDIAYALGGVYPLGPRPAGDAEADHISETGQDELLAALSLAIGRNDAATAAGVTRRYAAHGHDAAALLRLLRELAITDDGSVLHNLKHLVAAAEEFAVLRHRRRWDHLIAAARTVAIYFGRDTEIYGHLGRLLGFARPDVLAEREE